MLSLFLPLTIYLQSVRGFSALAAGLTFAPMSLTSMVVVPFAGRLADKIGGKYILLTGLSLFTIGFGLVTFVAGPDSTWLTFLVPAIIAGAGMGMTFAPMTTVAMRNISPQMSGAASGILNTTRQLGAAIGSAVVGALLQSQLATTLHNQAVSHAGALPPSARDQFIAAFSSVASNGFQIGTGQNGAKLPAGLPPSVQHQITALAHDVFVSGYIDAMKATLVVPIAFLAFTALTTLLIRLRQRPAFQASRSVDRLRHGAAHRRRCVRHPGARAPKPGGGRALLGCDCRPRAGGHQARIRFRSCLHRWARAKRGQHVQLGGRAAVHAAATAPLREFCRCRRPVSGRFRWRLGGRPRAIRQGAG